MHQIIEKLRQEWSVVSKAPGSFIVCVVIFAGGIWMAMEWRYSGKIDNLEAKVAAAASTGELPASVQSIEGKALTTQPLPSIKEDPKDVQAREKNKSNKQRLNAKSESRDSSSTGSVYGNGNVIAPGMSGGQNIVNNTIVRERPPRILDDISGQRLLALLPSKEGITIQMTILTGPGSDERKAFAGQIMAFLKSNGYRVEDNIIWTMPFGGSMHPQVVYADTNNPSLMHIDIGENKPE